MTAPGRLGTLLMLLIAVPPVAQAQYFGRNKVQYSHPDWAIIQTEHFDVHFYAQERQAAMDVARQAERAYTQLSRILNHQFTDRKPIIVYASHSEFQQTNTTYGEVDEGTGGFTDFLRHRNVFPLTGSYRENEHVLMHEMVHQFQFDIWSRGRGASGIQGIFQANAPLWWAEGMAEYLSLGPVDPNTAMWLRDAALEGKLPKPQDFTRVFPYRFGHALVAYIGERWGDEAIGSITRGALGDGLQGSVRRVTGLSFEQLVAQWSDAVQKQYLPEVGTRVKARTVAQPLLTEELSEGTWHLAPALSPDGSRVAYFSEKDFYFVDLYLADGNTGKVIRRLLQSSYSSNYETYRFISSSVAWSADGQYLAFAAKRGGKDDLVIVDPHRNKQIRGIELELNGALTPTWSPDGTQIAFTGLDGGLADLYIINTDGTGLRRLTNDRYTELHPSWSPDGRSIAFTTDRGPETDFQRLTLGNYRIGVLDIASGEIAIPAGMDVGKNVSPQWSPDSRTIAFISDRNGINNIYLHDLGRAVTTRITDFYTGVSGITPLSPVLSWSHGSDRLAFVYFEDSDYDVYTLTNPRAIASERGVIVAGAGAIEPARRADSTASAVRSVTPSPATPPPPPQVLAGGTVYRGVQGFRPAGSLGQGADSTLPVPLEVTNILRASDIGVPDTSEFVLRDYRTELRPAQVLQPSIGYVRDNFGNGVTGQAGIVLDDMLGNKQAVIAASLNGRIEETQFLAAYVNLTRRWNWTASLSQTPYFFYNGSFIDQGNGRDGAYVTQLRRIVYRQFGGDLSYPMSRFRRVELGANLVQVQDDILQIVEPFDLVTGFATAAAELVTQSLGSSEFVQPRVALVFDNSLSNYFGAFIGRRSRFELSQTFGGWKYTQALADYRRYDPLIGPLTLATRLMYFGRIGRDAQLFNVFGGSTELIRGHTYGSYTRNECGFDNLNSATECRQFDALIGSQVGVASAEIRYHLPVFIPGLTPGLELAAFYDIGMVWNETSTVKWRRDPGDDPAQVRVPLQTFGGSARTNLLGAFIIRLDYSIPQNRRGIKGLWTISLSPAF
ncbi:MAG: BamA/TamA family outer membrane protein [Gemmatimonadota bacterium]|nr:BamA/TamA family outer membrane protein [Gemmatimonadota bacterium]